MAGVRYTTDDVKKLKPRYQEQIAKAVVKGDTARTTSDMEQGAGNGAVEKEEVARFDGPVRIAYTEHRRRATDSDGACTKYVTDSLVEAKLLPNDGPQVIPERPSHVSIIDDEEYTVIEIFEVE